MFSIKFAVIVRSKATHKTDKLTVEVFDGQDATETINNQAASYGATVESFEVIRSEDGAQYMHTMRANAVTSIKPYWFTNSKDAAAYLEILKTAGYFTKNGQAYCTTAKFDAFYTEQTEG